MEASATGDSWSRRNACSVKLDVDTESLTGGCAPMADGDEDVDLEYSGNIDWISLMAFEQCFGLIKSLVVFSRFEKLAHISDMDRVHPKPLELSGIAKVGQRSTERVFANQQSLYVG